MPTSADWTPCSLYGIGVHQFYRYLRTFPTDAVSIRVVVCSEFLGPIRVMHDSSTCNHEGVPFTVKYFPYFEAGT